MPDLRYESIRVGFGRGLKRAGVEDERIVVLSADLAESTQVSQFKEAYPERYIEVGVAEQNLVTVASGLAHAGKRPFAASFAVFSPGRNWEQIRTTICINDQPVTIVGSHAGLNAGADGATHQALEDIALMRVLPNMTVIVPGDSVEAERVALALSSHNSPAYVRIARDKTPVFLEEVPFVIGEAQTLRNGSDVALLGTGTMTGQLVEVAELLVKRGVSVRVVHVPTIKPLDVASILDAARVCGRVVTAEDGQIAGGFGSAVAELLSEQLPVPIKRLGVNDVFGQSGSADEVLQHYGLTATRIVESLEQWLEHTPQYHR